MAAAAKAASEELLEESGLNNAERDYTKEKGIYTARHLERSAADEQNFIESVVKPFLQKALEDAVEHKEDLDAAVAQTYFLECLDSALDTVAMDRARQMGEEIPGYYDNGRLVWMSRTMADVCLRAESWARRWVAMSSEDIIERVEEFRKNPIRTNAFGNHQVGMKIFQQVYTAAQWRVACDMQAGVTFVTAVDELIRDEKWIERQVKQAEPDKAPYHNRDSGKLADKDQGKGGGRQSDMRRSCSRSRGEEGGG